MAKTVERAECFRFICGMTAPLGLFLRKINLQCCNRFVTVNRATGALVVSVWLACFTLASFGAAFEISHAAKSLDSSADEHFLFKQWDKVLPLSLVDNVQQVFAQNEQAAFDKYQKQGIAKQPSALRTLRSAGID